MNKLNLKKMLLGLGTISIIAAPIATTVSCGGTSSGIPAVNVPAITSALTPGTAGVDIARTFAQANGANLIASNQKDFDAAAFKEQFSILKQESGEGDGTYKKLVTDGITDINFLIPGMKVRSAS